MRKARQEWSDLNPEQRASSNEVHKYDEVKRVYMPCENPPRIARDGTSGKIKERVATYAGRVDDRNKYALLNFVRRAKQLQHCKPLTTLQANTVRKYRVKDVTELARIVRIGAQEMRRHTWEFRVLPKSPEGDRTRWRRTNTSSSDNQSSEANHDSGPESNIDRQEKMNTTRMEFDDTDDEPVTKPSSRRLSTEELIVDAQAKQAAQAQEQQAASITMLATSQNAAMNTMARAMDCTSKPPALMTSPVVDTIGQELYSLEQFQTIAPRYTYKEIAHHLQHEQKTSKLAHTTKASQIMEDTMNEHLGRRIHRTRFG
jgi:hypothetical protein